MARPLPTPRPTPTPTRRCAPSAPPHTHSPRRCLAKSPNLGFKGDGLLLPVRTDGSGFPLKSAGFRSHQSRPRQGTGQRALEQTIKGSAARTRRKAPSLHITLVLPNSTRAPKSPAAGPRPTRPGQSGCRAHRQAPRRRQVPNVLKGGSRLPPPARFPGSLGEAGERSPVICVSPAFGAHPRLHNRLNDFPEVTRGSTAEARLRAWIFRLWAPLLSVL